MALLLATSPHLIWMTPLPWCLLEGWGSTLTAAWQVVFLQLCIFMWYRAARTTEAPAHQPHGGRCRACARESGPGEWVTLFWNIASQYTVCCWTRQSLFDHIPVGVGSKGVIPTSAADLDAALELGMWKSAFRAAWILILDLWLWMFRYGLVSEGGLQLGRRQGALRRVWAHAPGGPL
jgi:hypothetical protein